MPNFALHVLLASRVAESWRTRPDSAPVDPDEPANINALLHGSVGPDMGMYPGGEVLVSDVVHRIRTGELVRNMLDSADDDAQRAFAWGWVTHIVADVLIHPLVNRAAADLLGRRHIDLMDPLQGVAHVRVELGLDAEYLARNDFLRHTHLRPMLDETSVGFLHDALRATYHVEFAAAALLRSHLAVVRLHRHLLLLNRAVAAGWGRRVRATPALLALLPLLPVARTVARMTIDARSSVAGFLDPVRPAPALLRDVDDVVAAFPDLVHPFVASGGALLDNYDLETGGVESPYRPTPTTLATLRDLDRRGLALTDYPAREAA
ncbi:MAG: zinc dependent phospholipase C family protein [Gemmatimonadota bacterium]|jgi:hypothetical protein